MCVVRRPTAHSTPPNIVWKSRCCRLGCWESKERERKPIVTLGTSGRCAMNKKTMNTKRMKPFYLHFYSFAFHFYSFTFFIFILFLIFKICAIVNANAHM